ncbi:MAG: WD40 repeat domain-containing protein [Gammaproteobacteria bacterium]|nr:WD40 repeat domain-containing protein [Gammaproteobacteria bacterium]
MNATRSVILSMLLYLFLSSPLRAADPLAEPVLRLETGMHTAPIYRIATDAQGRWLLTASHDKTLRLWDLTDGALLKIYRPPIGSGKEGKLYAGTMAPDGTWVAAGGWTGYEWDNSNSVYIFDRASGAMLQRLSGLKNVVHDLCVSPDGQWLGAALGWQGIRVWDTQTWSQVFRDDDYADKSHGCDFAADNRLVTSSYDGYVRLYAPESDTFRLNVKNSAPGGNIPYTVRFHPDGDRIAVGFNGSTAVNVLDAGTLNLLHAPDTAGIDNGDLSKVAWSADGRTLYAGGSYRAYQDNQRIYSVLAWPEAGLGSREVWPGSPGSLNTVMDLRALPGNRIAYGTAASAWAVLTAGQKTVERTAVIADYRNNNAGFQTSADGAVVEFGFEAIGARPARFELLQQRLFFLSDPGADASLSPPDTQSLNITDWKGTTAPQPQLDGKSLALEPHETPRSLAISPGGSRFVLGTQWYLRLFDAAGEQIWKTPSPDTSAWAVNISGDGQKALAAFGDGTIRWYRISDGQELLAFFPHKDGKRWIVWTPSGYYMSSSDNIDNLIAWHVNNGKDRAASSFPAGALYSLYKRPDIVLKILVTLDEAEAVRLADLEKEGSVVRQTDESLTTGEAIEEIRDDYEVQTEPGGLGRAVIIAASGAQDSNTLFDFSQEFAVKMYRTLRKKGFSDKDVIFMSQQLPIVPEENDTDIARLDFWMKTGKSKQELEEAIAQAGESLSAGQQFVFYLHGHAGIDKIQLDKNKNSDSYLSAQEFKELLAKIPAGVEQIIVLDTCYSGAFLDDLAGMPDRVVITSSDAKSQARSEDSKSFADTFIRKLDSGSSVGGAFKLAEEMILADSQVFGAQRPQLDDSLDGVYNKGEDGGIADNLRIGKTRAKNRLPHAALPEITEVHPAIELAEGQSTATLWVKAVPDFNGMKKMRAFLHNENDKATVYQGEETVFTQKELILRPDYREERYEVIYDKFDTAKNWRISYQAQNMEGEWSDFKEGRAEALITDNPPAIAGQCAVYDPGASPQINIPCVDVGDAAYRVGLNLVPAAANVLRFAVDMNVSGLVAATPGADCAIYPFGPQNRLRLNCLEADNSKWWAEFEFVPGSEIEFDFADAGKR